MMDRSSIRERAIGATRSLPGAVALHEFGSALSGEVDHWSDIDLQVVTTTLTDAIARRATVYAEIAPAWLEWTIVHDDATWAATVLFEDVSPFAHLDLGLVAEDADTASGILAQSSVLWRQSPAPATGTTAMAAGFAPTPGSIDHVVTGDLLSILRYAKARHRGHHLLCWKFFAALANRVLEAEFLATVDPGRGFRSSLTSHEHAQLRHALPSETSDALSRLLMCDAPASMDAAMLDLGQQLLETTAPFAVDRAGMMTAGMRLLYASADVLGRTSPINTTTVPVR
jgi:hypothetical protein